MAYVLSPVLFSLIRFDILASDLWYKSGIFYSACLNLWAYSYSTFGKSSANMYVLFLLHGTIFRKQQLHFDKSLVLGRVLYSN